MTMEEYKATYSEFDDDKDIIAEITYDMESFANFAEFMNIKNKFNSETHSH
jgi:hypothetical protein